MKARAFSYGRNEARYGKRGRASNPYAAGTDEHRQWNEGFDRGVADSDKAQDEHAARVEEFGDDEDE